MDYGSYQSLNNSNSQVKKYYHRALCMGNIWLSKHLMIHNNWVTTDNEPKKVTELAEKNEGNLICWSLMTSQIVASHYYLQLKKYQHFIKSAQQKHRCPSLNSTLWQFFFKTTCRFSSGHYTAYCWNAEGSFWAHCNDARLDLCSIEDVTTSQAYILFYTKRTSNILDSTPEKLPPPVTTATRSKRRRRITLWGSAGVKDRVLKGETFQVCCNML